MVGELSCLESLEMVDVLELVPEANGFSKESSCLRSLSRRGSTGVGAEGGSELEGIDGAILDSAYRRLRRSEIDASTYSTICRCPRTGEHGGSFAAHAQGWLSARRLKLLPQP